MCCTFSTCRNIKRWFGQPSDAGGDETMTKSYPCNEQLTRNSRATALNWTGEVCYTRLIITTHEFKPVITYYLGRPTVTSSIIFNCRMKMLMSRISPAPCDCWDSDTFCVCAIHLCIHRHHLQWGRTVWEPLLWRQACPANTSSASKVSAFQISWLMKPRPTQYYINVP